jgi:hypothetical protein
MGLSQRKKSGNIIAGSTLIVPGQTVLNVKRFPPTFNKKGSLPDINREQNYIPPTPPPIVITNYILTENNLALLTEYGEHLVWTY